MRRIGVSVLFVLMGVAVALAQLPSGTILGVVKDASGGVVPGAAVTARNVDTAQSRSIVTQADGSYRFNALPVGNYEVRVTAKGFQESVHSGLTLTVSQQAVVNFALQVGAASQTVVVTTEAPLVNTTSGTLGGLVNEARVTNLPLNGRNYLDLSLLQPGINVAQNRSAGEAAWISSNGSPVVSNYYLLDGTPTRNLYGRNPSSQTATVLGVDSIKEFRLISDAMPAQYGMAMGSELEVVSKGGTNQFHGDVFEYLRNSVLDARNFYETAKPPFKRNQFGASLGGPIQKDKTFFFANWESLHERLGITEAPPSLDAGCIQAANAVVWNGIGAQPSGSVGPCPQLGINPDDPDPSNPTLPYTVTVNQTIAPILALYPANNSPDGSYHYLDNRPLLDNFGNARIDHTFSANDNMFVRFTTDQATQTYQSQVYPPWTDIPNSQNYWITAGETHIFNPNLLSTARFSWAGTRLATDGPLPYTDPQYQLVQNQPLGDILNLQLGTMLGPDPPLPIIYRQYIWTGSDDLFYTRGKHSLKFGVLINRFTQEPIANVFTRGLVVFPSVAAFMQGNAVQFRGLTLAPGTTTARQYRFWTYGFYTQDDYRATSRLTLNLGLRYEFNTVPREVNGLEYSIRNPLTGVDPIHGALMDNHSLHNFSPRVGFAWDVFGSGKTAVRGGYALLYDIENIAPLLGLVPIGEPPLSFQSFYFHPPTLTGLPLTFPTAGNSLDMIDYNLQQPSMHQFNLTVEQQLPWDMALTVTYAGSLGRHLIISGEQGNPIVPAGVPAVSGGVESCVPRPAGQALDLTSLVDGSATACFLDTTNDKSPYFGYPQPRVNSNWSSIGYRSADRNSVYHALEIEVNKRLSHGLQFQSSFTWSKSLDQMENIFGSDNANTEDAGVTDPFHPATDRGPSVFDVGKNWRFNALYNFPNPHSSGFVDKALGGWWVSGIETILSGFPFTPCLNADQSVQGFDNNGPCASRPNIVPGRSLSSITSGTSPGCTTIGGLTVAPGTPLGTPNMWFDPCAFTLQPTGFLGTAGRNILRGPSEVNLDLTIAKDTKLAFLGETGSLQFRADFFNVFNKANYQFGNNGAGTALSVDGTTPGRLIDTATTPRQIQFALKLLF